MDTSQLFLPGLPEQYRVYRPRMSGMIPNHLPIDGAILRVWLHDEQLPQFIPYLLYQNWSSENPLNKLLPDKLMWLSLPLINESKLPSGYTISQNRDGIWILTNNNPKETLITPMYHNGGERNIHDGDRWSYWQFSH